LEYEQKLLKYKGRVVFEKMRLPYFKRLPKEFFENEACFIFVNEGAFSVRSQTDYLSFQKGTALLAKCLNYFFETSAQERRVGTGVEVIGLLLYPELVLDIFDYDLSISTHKVDFNLKKFEVNLLLHHFKESINVLLDNPELADEELIKNKLREFVLLMSKTVEAPSELDFLASLFKPHYAQFEEIIQKNLYANLNLTELEALCHMSLSSFKRKFSDVYSESPIKYLSKKKVQRAAILLKDKSNRISDIAFDVGFESLATFNRSFKEIFGVSPSEYRLN
jgi:AraC family transcriptional regulator, exoenzyme S synthesis regulatory protein ExsA